MLLRLGSPLMLMEDVDRCLQVGERGELHALSAAQQTKEIDHKLKSLNAVLIEDLDVCKLLLRDWSFSQRKERFPSKVGRYPVRSALGCFRSLIVPRLCLSDLPF